MPRFQLTTGNEYMARLYTFLIFIGILCTVPGPGRAQTTSNAPLSPRIVSYRIDARLDPATHRIRGRQVVTWRNPDRVPVDELQFHLYLNGFKSEKTTWMRESGGQHRGFSRTDKDPWGQINLKRLNLVRIGPNPTVPITTTEGTGKDLLTGARFIRPDDGNPNDETLLSVPLPQPVAPGETIVLSMDFVSQLPQIVARTGWARTSSGDPFFMAGQWFPKLAAYEIPGQRYVPTDAPRGRWNSHQFHANSEFYADFGTYDVSVSVPKGYVVGASGVRTGAVEKDTTVTLTYRAADIHDFAWTASPAYRVYEDRWKHVHIRLLIQPEHVGQVQRHLTAARKALEYAERWVGPYPYTTLTLVDGVGGSNGMEYPTLITVGTDYAVPSWVRMPELTLIHEFMHQYFYGMLASNEMEEAWLDEGFTSYMEMRIADVAYGEGAIVDFPGLRIQDAEYQRLSYMLSTPSRHVIFKRSWEYASFNDYGIASYPKPAVVLKSLENFLGQPVMHRVLRTYYNRWRFKHPATTDFIAVAEEVSGKNLDWFFDQFVYRNVVVDYAVKEIKNAAQAVRSDSTSAGKPRWNTVVVERKGDAYFPQTVQVGFEDGTSTRFSWNGRDNEKSFRFKKAISEVSIDPDNHVWLDVDRLNNRKSVDADNTLARKVHLKAAVWIQMFFSFLSALF